MTRPFLPDELYHFLGHSLAVRSNSPEALQYVRSVYGRFRARRPGRATALLQVVDRVEEAGELVIRDDRGTQSLRCRDIHSLDGDGHAPPEAPSYPLAQVEGTLLRYVARLATGHDLYHAAAVARHGGAVALAGPSGRGKTTLCLALLRRGWQLLSDELACVRHDRPVVDPFPRLLKLDEQSRRSLDIPEARVTRARYTDHGEPVWLLEVEDAAPCGVSAPAPLRAVVLLEGFAAVTRVEPVPPMQALLALSRLSLRRPADAAAAVFGAAPFVGTLPCYTLAVSDLDEAARTIGDLIAEAGVDA